LVFTAILMYSATSAQLTSQLTAQDSLTIDSLRTEIKNQVDPDHKIELYQRIGSIYYRRGKVDLVFEEIEKAMEISSRLSDKKSHVRMLYTCAAVHSKQGDYRKGIEYVVKAEKLLGQVSDSGIRDSLQNRLTFFKGVEYRNLHDFEKAKKNLFVALEGFIAKKDSNSIAFSCINLSTIYLELAELDSANLYIEQGLLYSNRPYARRLLLNSRGEVFLAQKRYDEARVLFEEGYAFSEGSNNYDFINSLNLLIEVDIAQYGTSNRLDEAIEVYAILKDFNYYAIESNLSANISKMLEKAQRYSEALMYLKRHIALNDTINSEKRIKELTEIENREQTLIEKAANEKKLLIKDQKIALEKENTEKQLQRQYFSWGILGIILILGGFLFRRYLITKRQKEQIAEQNIKIETQHEILEETHKEITDSITYAKRIQEAILPPTRLVKEWLPNSFVLYKPKDIVAGDFYWMESVNDTIIFAAADCTGHGVPGAMVSVVCHNALNRAVREFGCTVPGAILDKTRELVIQQFEKSDEEVKDGMDIAICTLQGLKLQYAGAHNPLWIITQNSERHAEFLAGTERSRSEAANGSTLRLTQSDQLTQDDPWAIIEIKADKQPIGKFDHAQPYTNHQMELTTGDTVYIFSDGFVDQFGGEKGKKFKARAFRELLLSIQSESMEVQRQRIDSAFESWRGDIEQVDDVCVIGVKL
jgi:serine phosphatase RsbU (regulator of sigma subunit)